MTLYSCLVERNERKPLTGKRTAQIATTRRDRNLRVCTNHPTAQMRVTRTPSTDRRTTLRSKQGGGGFPSFLLFLAVSTHPTTVQPSLFLEILPRTLTTQILGERTNIKQCSLCFPFQTSRMWQMQCCTIPRPGNGLQILLDVAGDGHQARNNESGRYNNDGREREGPKSAIAYHLFRERSAEYASWSRVESLHQTCETGLGVSLT